MQPGWVIAGPRRRIARAKRDTPMERTGWCIPKVPIPVGGTFSNMSPSICRRLSAVYYDSPIYRAADDVRHSQYQPKRNVLRKPAMSWRQDL